MKKKMAKLVLAKETVRDLTTQDLREAAGGTSAIDCYTAGCNSYQWLKAGTSVGGGCTR